VSHNPWSAVRPGDWVRVAAHGVAIGPLPKIQVRLEAVAVRADGVDVAILPEAPETLPETTRRGALVQMPIHRDLAPNPPIRQGGTFRMGEIDYPLYCDQDASMHATTQTCATWPWGPLTLVNGFMRGSIHRLFPFWQQETQVIAVGHDAAPPATPPGGWAEIIRAEPATFHTPGTYAPTDLDQTWTTLGDGLRTQFRKSWSPAQPGDRDPVSFDGGTWKERQVDSWTQDLAALAVAWVDANR